MKRTICFILLLALSLSCFACAKPAEIEASGTAKPTGDPTSEPTAEPTAEPTEEPTPEPTEEPTPEPTPYELPWEKMNDYEPVAVEMPCVFDWETEADKEKNYDIDPFEISFILPTGWSVKDEPDENGLMCVFDNSNPMLKSKQYVYDETGRCVGAFGYALYDEPQYAGHTELYCKIAVANHYQFNVHEHYIPVVETSNTVTALTQVFYSKQIRENYPDTAVYDNREMNNLGIVSYNPEIHIFVAFEFAENYISAIEYMDIAESLRFN